MVVYTFACESEQVRALLLPHDAATTIRLPACTDVVNACTMVFALASLLPDALCTNPTVVLFETVTTTPALMVVLPAASFATAVSVWLPLVAVAELQENV